MFSVSTRYYYINWKHILIQGDKSNIIKLLNDKYLLFCHLFFTCILISEEKNNGFYFFDFFSLNNTHLFSQSSRCWQSEIKVSALKGNIYLPLLASGGLKHSLTWGSLTLVCDSSLLLCSFFLLKHLLAFRITIYSKFSISSRYFYQCICQDYFHIRSHSEILTGCEFWETLLLAWRIPRTEEPGRLQSIGSQRVEHKWSDLAQQHILPHNFNLLIIRNSRHFLLKM